MKKIYISCMGLMLGMYASQNTMLIVPLQIGCGKVLSSQETSDMKHEDPMWNAYKALLTILHNRFSLLPSSVHYNVKKLSEFNVLVSRYDSLENEMKEPLYYDEDIYVSSPQIMQDKKSSWIQDFEDWRAGAAQEDSLKFIREVSVRIKSMGQ